MTRVLDITRDTPPLSLDWTWENLVIILIDFRDISSCIMDMSYQSWSRPSLCDSGLWSSLPEYWYATPVPQPPLLVAYSFCPPRSVLSLILILCQIPVIPSVRLLLVMIYMVPFTCPWPCLHSQDYVFLYSTPPFAFPSLQIFRMLNWAEDRGDHLAPANIGGHSKLIRLKTLQSGVSSFEMHLYWHPPTLEIPFICANISWIQCGG